MSEAIDVDSDNLCTTEDAFEKFQNVSMYEEDEYITLADIVSPPPPNRDISEILHEMPSDEVSSLVVEETSNQVSSTTDQNVQETTPTKRGRKEKSDLESSSCQVSELNDYYECSADNENKNNVSSQGLELNYNNSVSNGGQALPETPNDSYLSLEAPKISKRGHRRGRGRGRGRGRYIRNKKPQETKPLESKIPRKRGRPVRPKNIEVPAPSTNEDYTSSIDNINNVGNINEVLVENTEIKTTKRGRRKKKIPSELIEFSNEVIIEPEPDLNLATPKEAAPLPSENIEKKHKKRRESRKNLSKDTSVMDEQQESENLLLVPIDQTEDEMEDMPLVAFSHKIAKLEKSDTSNIQIDTENDLLNKTTQLNETKDNIAVQKIPKKRGRRKKVDLNKDANNLSTTNGTIEESDDLGLNNLKDSISNSEANKKDSENINIKDEKDVQEFQESDSPNKRNSKKPIMSDFEYNIDSIIKNDNENQYAQQLSEHSEMETTDSSKRPVRRKAKKNLHYDEGSDEDPYANVELSDDEPRRRKGGRYNSDDEYIPGRKRSLSDMSDSDMDMDIDEEVDDLLRESTKQKGRQYRKSESGSPRKRTKKGDSNKVNNLDVVTQKPSATDSGGDLEELLETSIIKTSDVTPKAWGSTQEFNEFLFKISQGTDIKIKKSTSVDNTKTPIQIPVLDPNEAKKTAEMCAQTDTIKTKAVSVQTTSVHEVPMKNQVPLTADLSQKACEFLTSIVKTTAELGQLMTQKSEDFIDKKINTSHVTDTFKMDYCVKKSFLLFRLAKNNLVQMEEDLAKQYEEFLKKNNLIQHREEQKVIESTSKATNSDSDCEIVEEPAVHKKAEKQAFNPKTVFLNKELSIKIAKKPSEEPKPKEDVKIKARHTVWINDSIMVKKVKPTQSFLAQDSRNKKPPDTYVTLEMVSDFFMKYNRQRAISTCAQFVTPEWLTMNQNYTCCYFFDKSCESSESSIASNQESTTEVADTENHLQILSDTKPLHKCPNSLSSLCTGVIQKMMCVEDPVTKTIASFDSCRLVNICKDETKNYTHLSDLNKNGMCIQNINQQSVKIEHLKTLCYKKVMELFHVPEFSESYLKIYRSDHTKTYNSIYEIDEDKSCEVIPEYSSLGTVKPLFSLCLTTIQDCQEPFETANLVVDTKEFLEPDSLKSIVFNEVKHIFCERMCSNKNYEDKASVDTGICMDYLPTILNQIPCKHFSDKFNPSSLQSLCFNVVKETFNEYDEKCNIDLNSLSTFSNQNQHSFDRSNPSSLKSLCFDVMKKTSLSTFSNQNQHSFDRSNPSSLKSLCFDVMKKTSLSNFSNQNQHSFDRPNPSSLKSLCFDVMNKTFYGHDVERNIESHTGIDSLNFTINNVNTVSEDVFLNGTSEEYSEDDQIESTYLGDEEHNYSDDCETSYDNNVEEDDNNWVSQVQMKELRSFVEPTNNNDHEEPSTVSDLPPNGIVNIKIEPIDELLENIIEENVKTEPLDEEETTVMPLVAVTKQENADAATSSKEPIERQKSNSYDGNAFEAFVSSNKMITALDSYETTNEEIFTQSTARVRRQYEPDSDSEIENYADSLNLLVPQNVETAKDRLMESSSDEDTDKKKKPEKRSRGRPKKPIKAVNVPPAKENLPSKSELAVLTRKMREKIRQVEKQNESSESELDDTLSVMKEKVKDKASKSKSNGNKDPENEIQCNDVDSTEQINENIAKENENVLNEDIETVNEQSEAAVGYEEEQNQENDEDSQLADVDDRSNSPLIDREEPVELLECEPNISLFENLMEKPRAKRKLKLKTNAILVEPTSEKIVDPPYIDRHGWNCYPIDTKDGKIYQYAQIVLNKLPESFVETYLKYQDLSEQAKDDSEVDKLINLQSLHRTQSKEKGRLKVKESKNSSTDPGKGKSSEEGNELVTDIKPEPCDELSPSEDEGENTEDIPPPATSQPSAENCLAKDFLMNDDDDDDAEKHDGEGKKSEKSPKKADDLNETGTKKPRPKSKVEEDKVKPKNLMLTADKMMTKELALLHAPVDLEVKQEVLEAKDVTKTASKSTHKTSPKTHTSREHKDKDDDSSSEEEKQWFTTKEKLLKRLEKKQECPSVDDAKRAKIVSEFIEKRSDGPTVRLRGRPSRRRSLKKLMERRKQMKILTRELLGDDSAHIGKKSTQNYGKGRRNIRKVINKKALSQKTVLANMEEFERKKRLNMRQTQLREILGCEEGVNVVVINDELCLEYDFEELRPVVTVHPFFTKVMKAHQYEGVKFMWDACFESVSQVQSGHAGGGCILAHCMGLGKTLQVLALLHTVLTHPQVGMQRVLVCCPLSTVLNWVDEIHKWIGPVTGQIKVFELSKLKKTYERAYQLEDWYSGGGIFIIGYELFRSLSTIDPVFDCVRATIVNKIRTALLDPGPDIIICDEGHLLKNDCSVLAVAMSRVKTRRRIVLTGTPMQNNLREYYCMVNFVKPHLLGSYSEYSNRFENPIMNGQHRDSIEEDIKLMKARTHILHKVLEGCLQRQEASVLYPYLPKKYEYTVFVSLTKSQRELYMHYLTNYAKETKQSVLKDFHVLQKIWTHPQVLHNFFMKAHDDDKQHKIKVEKEDDLVAEDLGASEDTKPTTMETWWLPYVADSDVLDALHSSNKFLVIFRLLDECIALGDKVLIFSTSLYTMDALEYFLRRINNWSLGREYYRLDGSVPAEVRQKWCREFNAETNTGTKLFLISTRAGSLGLNMTAANRVVILDTSWNPAHDIQSIFRVYRFGQKKDCFIYRLVAMGTMEQKIYERSVTKQAVACRVVDEQQIDRHYNMSELTELYRLDEDGSGVSAGLAAGVRDAALLRVASSETPAGPLLYAVHEHDSLLRGSGETGLPEDERAAVWSQFQEEHANKHIQSIAMNLPKISLKIIPKTENTQQDANNQPAPGASDAKPKKRGRKPAANKNMPQPSTSVKEEPYPNPDIEESMIKKIMDILIQHNFHTTNGPQEIADLIKNVRKTVANPNRARFKNIDPMTASIAKVLIQEGTGNPVPSMDTNTGQNQSYIAPTNSEETIVGTPADYNSIYSADQNDCQSVETDYSGRKRRRKGQEANSNQEQTAYGETDSMETIVGTPVDNSIYFEDTRDSQDSQESAEYPDRRKKRQRRKSDEEYVPDKHTMKKLTIANIPTTRKSNEYNSGLDTNPNVTITSDLPPTVTPSDSDSQLAQMLNTRVRIKKGKGKTKKISKKKNETDDMEPVKEEERQKGVVENMLGKEPPNGEKQSVDASESILLSDDDDAVETLPAKVPNMIPQANIKLENIKREKQPSNKPDDGSPIPLHKSLLTNKNFIKIVAHTYLSGNPKLDEDAAILAAQYSTLKALKELEATNKEIVSGPIYDIAVQVLGRELLKKLHNTNKKDGDTVRLSPSSPNETVTKTSGAKQVEDVSEVAPQKQIKKKPGPRGKTMGVKKVEAATSASIMVIDDDFEMPSTSASVPAAKRRSAPQSVSAPEVVPVEMFQGPGPASMRSRFPSQDECILPDDDDVIVGHSETIVGHSETIAGHSETIAGHSQTRPNKRNSKPLLMNSASIATEKASVTQPKVVQIVQKQPVVNPIPLPPPPIILNNIIPDICPVGTPFRSSTATICLDSDEEDSPPVAPVKTTRKAVKSTTKLPHSTPATSDAPKANNMDAPITTQSRLNAILENKKKVLLVPASDYDKNAPSQGFHMLSQSFPTRLEVSPPETIVPEEMIPNDDYPIIQTKSKCMPGDIIRINKAGKIEILRKTVKPPGLILTGARNSTAPIESEEFIRVGNTQMNKVNVGSTKASATFSSRSQMNAAEKIHISKAVETAETPRTSYSNDMRSESPDPLSVLKNVVHIPADQYQGAYKGTNRVETQPRVNRVETQPRVNRVETQPRANRVETQPRANRVETQPRVNRVETQPRVNRVETQPRANRVETEPRANRIETQPRPNPPVTAHKSVEREKTIVKSSSDVAFKKAEALLKSLESVQRKKSVKGGITSNTSNSSSTKAGNKVIDLTEGFPPMPARSTLTKKPVSTKSLSLIKLTGTSKDISISNAGTLISNAKNKPSTSFTPPTKTLSTKKPAAAIPQKTPTSAPEVSKRPSPWQDPLPNKKKKTDGSKLTLADFNIDELDDIIELE